MQHLIFFYVICGLCIVWLFFAINNRIRMFIIFTNNWIDMRCYFQYVYCDSVCYWNFVFSLILAMCGFYLKQIKRCISVDLSKVIPFWKYGIAIFFFLLAPRRYWFVDVVQQTSRYVDPSHPFIYSREIFRNFISIATINGSNS